MDHWKVSGKMGVGGGGTRVDRAVGCVRLEALEVAENYSLFAKHISIVSVKNSLLLSHPKVTLKVKSQMINESDDITQLLCLFYVSQYFPG